MVTWIPLGGKRKRGRSRKPEEGISIRINKREISSGKMVAVNRSCRSTFAAQCPTLDGSVTSTRCKNVPKIPNRLSPYDSRSKTTSMQTEQEIPSLLKIC